MAKRSKAKAKRAKMAKTKKAKTARRTTKKRTKKLTKTMRTGASGTDPCGAHSSRRLRRLSQPWTTSTTRLMMRTFRRRCERGPRRMPAATLKLRNAQRAPDQCRHQNP
jgi:hypothetical protein